MRAVVFAVSIGAAVMANGVAAQDSVRLRFAPPAGLTLHRVFQRHQRVELQGSDDRTRVLEVVQLGGITQVALQRDGEVTGVHLAFDSLRLRTREPGAPWSEVVVPGADTTWLQVALSQRLEPVLRGGELQPGSGSVLLHTLTGFPGVLLPDHWIRPGMRWRTQLQVSPSDPLIPGNLDDVVLRAVVAVVVDSIVGRARDTLAYLSIGGTSPRLRRRLDDGHMLAYEGTLAGTLVWSTGYVTFVSAATRLRVSVAVRVSGSPDPVRRMTIEATMRQAVVP